MKEVVLFLIFVTLVFCGDLYGCGYNAGENCASTPYQWETLPGDAITTTNSVIYNLPFAITVFGTEFANNEWVVTYYSYLQTSSPKDLYFQLGSQVRSFYATDSNF
jgi:hypothetical protein